MYEYNVITIDGPTASGKGTIAAALAKKLGFHYLATGLLYRAMAWLVQEQGSTEDLTQLDYQFLSQQLDTVLDKPELALEEIGMLASELGRITQLREVLLHYQQAYIAQYQEQGIVVEGRDIGTVIAPQARFKFFITADETIRAQRRLEQLLALGIEKDFQDVLYDIQTRDHNDMQRELSPLMAAEDAIIIDNSQQTVIETVAEILEDMDQGYVPKA